MLRRCAAALVAGPSDALLRTVDALHAAAASKEVRRGTARTADRFRDALNARGDVPLGDFLSLVGDPVRYRLPSGFVAEAAAAYLKDGRGTRADALNAVRWVCRYRPGALGHCSKDLMQLVAEGVWPKEERQPTTATVCRKLLATAHENGVRVDPAVVVYGIKACAKASPPSVTHILGVPQRRYLQGADATDACFWAMYAANMLGDGAQARAFFDEFVEAGEGNVSGSLLGELIRSLPADADVDAIIGPWLSGHAVGWAAPVPFDRYVVTKMLWHAATLERANEVALRAANAGVELPEEGYRALIKIALDNESPEAARDWYALLVKRHVPQPSTLELLAAYASVRCTAADDAHMTLLEGLVDMIGQDLLPHRQDGRHVYRQVFNTVALHLSKAYNRLGMTADTAALRRICAVATPQRQPPHDLDDRDEYRRFCNETPLGGLENLKGGLEDVEYATMGNM
eukprot:TRINITY_DN27627_c0_g1_i1.p1 TRINITY_DN27627_c0_g1~~TRINITY_DN27627_c0_g1_i1.p1  ORF type:complete len:459 (+),score=118.47 TRINITY_DN27627_c0_g1_i1:73-1449(+)